MKTLIVYYSKSGDNWFDGGRKILEKGNSQVVAEYLSELTQGSLFRIEMEEPYPEDYDRCVEKAYDDQIHNARPKLINLPENLKDISTIYLVYPIYWSLMPMPVFTFLDHYDFSGITIYPVSTHEGSGLGASVSTIRRLAKGAIIDDPLPIPGTLASKSYNRLKVYVESHQKKEK